VLRRIFGPKREEVVGGWRRLHNEELHKSYPSPNTIRVNRSEMIRWAGHSTRMGEMRNVYNSLVGKPVGKRPLGKSKRRWEDSIRMGLKEIGWKGVDWMYLTEVRE